MPWETEEETQLCIEEEEQFSQSDLGSQAIACAALPAPKHPLPFDAISITSSGGATDSGDLFASIIGGCPDKHMHFNLDPPQ